MWQRFKARMAASQATRARARTAPYRPETRLTRRKFEPSTTFRARRRPNLRTGGFLGIEYKFIDQTVALTAVSADWAGGELDPVGGVNCIGACTQGTGESNRDGRQINVKSIQIQGYALRPLASDSADPISPGYIKIALVQDTQTNGTQLNAEDVYNSGTLDEVAFRNLEYTRRFRVLGTAEVFPYVQATMTDGANTASCQGNLCPFSIRWKGNVSVNFSGNAGTIADIMDNSFHIIAAGNVSTDQVCYNSRVRFIG